MTLLARLLGLLRRGGTRSQTTPRFHAALRKHLACFESHPMYATWWEYASSTVQRGEQTVAILERFAPMKGCCCLDIGTAYGGFPIACRKAGATEAIGLEIDADVLVVARELAADLRCQIEYRAGDATDDHTVAALGTFDRITCNDVIEHVDNPSRLADHLSMLLRPGGLLLLEAPNMFCLDAVLRDGHYGLFGLTLIPREPAKRYYHQVFTDPYRVGDYLMLSEYLTMFAKRGLDAYHLNWTEANEEDLRKLRNGYETTSLNPYRRVSSLQLVPAVRRCAMEAYSPNIERMMIRLYRSLRENDRRRYAALEASRLGHGGVEYIARLLRCDAKTVRQGVAELEAEDELDPERVRKKGVDENA